MAIFRWFDSPDEVEPQGWNFFPIDADRSRILFSVEDTNLFGILEGRFDGSSQRALEKSPVKNYILSFDQSGQQPLFVAEKINLTYEEFFSVGFTRDGNDTLFGSNFSDNFFNEDGPGNDKIYAGNGSDLVLSGPGNDRLFGEEGNDFLVLGVGRDQATGGPGLDFFVLAEQSNGSTIRDFDRNEGEGIGIFGDLFDDPDAATADPEGFLRVTGKGTKFTLWLDVDGGGDGFVQWTKINGDLGSTDLDTLIQDGTLGLISS